MSSYNQIIRVENKRLYEEHNFTQAYVAEHMGITQSRFSQLLGDSNFRPRLERAIKNMLLGKCCSQCEVFHNGKYSQEHSDAANEYMFGRDTKYINPKYHPDDRTHWFEDSKCPAKDYVYHECVRLMQKHNIPKGAMISCTGNRPWEIAEMMSPAITELTAVDKDPFWLYEFISKANLRATRKLPKIIPVEEEIVQSLLDNPVGYTVFDFDGFARDSRITDAIYYNMMLRKRAIVTGYESNRGKSVAKSCYLNSNCLKKNNLKVLEEIRISYRWGQNRTIFVVEKTRR